VRAEETRDRESRVSGINVFRERERWGQGERRRVGERKEKKINEIFCGKG
jgi:hypothetical protein